MGAGATKVRSAVDGRAYEVQGGFADAQAAADMLATLRGRMRQVAQAVPAGTPVGERLRRNFTDRTELREKGTEGFLYSLINKGTETNTSFTVNKGDSVVLCIRSAEAPYRVHDENLLTFVAVHELAHMGCETYGHNEEFKRVFEMLLSVAETSGAWRRETFNGQRMYCGIKL